MPHSICEICGETFLKKFNLVRHVNSVHQSGKFKCEICNRGFNRTDTLKRHRITHNAKTAVTCEFCGRSYYNKGLLTQHLNYQHGNLKRKRKPKRIHLSPKIFECNECNKKFHHRHSIVRHLRNFHIAPKLFECEKCRRSYKSKERLCRHIRSVHECQQSLTCAKCKRSFQSEISLDKHSAKCSKVSEYTPTFICVKCRRVFARKYLLLEHYSDDHDVTLNYENLQFNSFEEFQKWKKEIECSTISAFNSFGVKETSHHYNRNFQCHRSGMYTETCKSDKRMNQLKKKGSKKLQGYCPGEINVKVNKSDGKCFVTFQKTHVGHEIGTENELCHIYLDRTKRLELTSQLAAKIPLHTILKNENESAINGKCDNRRRGVTRTDLRNIRYRYLTDPYPLADDSINVPTFVKENKNSVLYCKYKNEQTSITTLDKIFPFLPEDFVLIFMNSEQKKRTELFARNRIVSFDGTPCRNLEKYILHTMMVLNYNHEGVPAAFLLTNRNDEMVVTCFIECIKVQIGELNIKTLMTDVQDTYYNAWINVMPKPPYYLHCTWHVNQDWKLQYQQIVRNKRGKLRIALYKLQQELDEFEFEEKLVSFISQKEPCYQNFLKYFKSHYANAAKRWAYCYRTFSQINTNTHLESFHEHLRKSYFGRKKIKSLAACLCDIKKCISFQFQIEDMKEINFHSPAKLKLLNKRHVTAVEELKNFTIVDCNEPETWNVISDGNVYTVRKQNPECEHSCLLKCVECNDVCLHEYACSCIDHSIKYNMCKHIHALLLPKWLNSEEFSSLIVSPIITNSSLFPNNENPCSPNTISDENEILNKTREDCEVIARDIENKIDDESLWIEYKKMLQAFSEKINGGDNVEVKKKFL